jgi:hypothetical protein
MRAERVLARLSGGSIWRGQAAPGGKPIISNEELMGSLGGLAEGPTRLAYLMWGLMAADLPAAERAALVEASKLREIQHSRIGERPGLLRAFCRVAIAEVALPPICKSCKGAGYHGAKACKRCEGSGEYAMGLRSKAEIASVHYPCSKDTWKALAQAYPYEAVFCMVSRWKSKAIGHVYRQLAEPDMAVVA